MNKQQKQDGMKYIAHIAEMVYSASAQPYTFVEACCTIRINHSMTPYIFRGVGFAKVSHPDEWDQAKGLSIAYGRALSDICHKIREYGIWDMIFNSIEYRGFVNPLIARKDIVEQIRSLRPSPPSYPNAQFISSPTSDASSS